MLPINGCQKTHKFAYGMNGIGLEGVCSADANELL